MTLDSPGGSSATDAERGSSSVRTVLVVAGGVVRRDGRPEHERYYER
jgi:hypothetical protein